MQRLLDFPVRQTFAATLELIAGILRNYDLTLGVVGGAGPMFIVDSNGPIEPL